MPKPKSLPKKAQCRKIVFERDRDGIILPTLRNSEIVNNLFKETKKLDVLKQVLGKDYTTYFASTYFELHRQNVFFQSRKNASKASARWRMIDQLNKKWLAEKNRKSL
ncbi:MAG: hypothetical protein Q7S57_04025 [bacterium]|nr:hypothetical protein [bacterium]